MHVVSWFALWRQAEHQPGTVLQRLLCVLVAGDLAHRVSELSFELTGARGVRAVMAIAVSCVAQSIG